MGLGDPCGQGAATGHAIVGNILSGASSALLKPQQGQLGTDAEIGTCQLVDEARKTLWHPNST